MSNLASSLEHADFDNTRFRFDVRENLVLIIPRGYFSCWQDLKPLAWNYSRKEDDRLPERKGSRNWWLVPACDYHFWLSGVMRRPSISISLIEQKFGRCDTFFFVALHLMRLPLILPSIHPNSEQPQDDWVPKLVPRWTIKWNLTTSLIGGWAIPSQMHRRSARDSVQGRQLSQHKNHGPKEIARIPINAQKEMCEILCTFLT
jgi:hypothetical protein